MTLIEGLKQDITALGNISIPVAYMGQIGVPIYKVLNDLTMMKETLEKSEKENAENEQEQNDSEVIDGEIEGEAVELTSDPQPE